MKLPKYVRKTSTRSTALYYDRHVPKDLINVAGKPKVRIPLGLTEDAAGSAILKAAEDAKAEFDALVAMWQKSDALSDDDSALEALAIAALRKAGHSPGGNLKSKVWIPDEIGDEDERDRITRDLLDAMTEDATKHIDTRTKTGKAIKAKAREAFNKAGRKRRVTIEQLWLEYFNEKSDDWDKRARQRAETIGKRFLTMTGNFAVNQEDALERIHAGLDEFVQVRLSEVEASSVKRQMNVWLAALRRGARRYRLNWNIVPPDIGKIKNQARAVIEPSDQHIVIENADSPVGVLWLLSMTCATMQSEIARLNLDDALATLSDDQPHLVFEGKLKTKARTRICPVVVRPDLIIAHLPALHEWLNEVTESNVAHVAKNHIRSILPHNDRLTLHCGRHTYKAAAIQASANPFHTSLIAGWSFGGFRESDHAIAYGREAISQGETLKALTKTQKQIWSHLISRKSGRAKVVSIKRKRR